MKYLDDTNYLDDTFKSLEERFKDYEEFIYYYNSLESDFIKNEFLRVGSSYLFFVKNGNWHVDVPRSDEIISYFNNSYKLIGIIGLVESLSEEKYRDFYTWLIMKKNKIDFPIESKNILEEHYKKYKKEYGAIKKCIGFFENLTEPSKNEIFKLIQIGDEQIDNMKIFVEMLYKVRSEFAHESSMSLEIGDWFHIGKHKGKTVLWRKFKIEYLQKIFEEGVIQHFNKYTKNKLHNQPFKADSRRLTF